jgi:hypothetical protein
VFFGTDFAVSYSGGIGIVLSVVCSVCSIVSSVGIGIVSVGSVAICGIVCCVVRRRVTLRRVDLSGFTITRYILFALSIDNHISCITLFAHVTVRRTVITVPICTPFSAHSIDQLISWNAICTLVE